MSSPSTEVALELVPGTVGPRYADAIGADLERVVITEQGTASKLPLVDLVLRTRDGKTIIVTTTGRVILTLAAALRGVNLRNHGTREP